MTGVDDDLEFSKATGLPIAFHTHERKIKTISIKTTISF